MAWYVKNHPKWGGPGYCPLSKEAQEEGFFEMFLVSYHNGLPLSKAAENSRSKLFYREDWNRYHFSCVLEAAHPDYTEEQIEELLQKVWDQWYKEDVGGPSKEGLDLYDEEVGREGSVYFLQGRRSQILNLLKPWIEEIKCLEYWNRGDDSYYDYAPDEVSLIYQIARAIDAKDIWDDFIKWVKEVAYPNDGDEEIPEYSWS